MIDREPLQGVPTGAHEPGVASLDTAPLFQCQLSMLTDRGSLPISTVE